MDDGKETAVNDLPEMHELLVTKAFVVYNSKLKLYVVIELFSQDTG